MLLTSPIQRLDKIGPKYARLLENLGIFTVGDLLYHFPFRYDDLSDIRKICDLEQGITVTIECVLEKIQNIYTRTGKKLTKAVFSDTTGMIDAVWFNQHFITRILKPNTNYFISGRVGESNGKIALVNPQFEEITQNSLNTARLVPIYPETAGVSSKWLRTRINDVLSQIKSGAALAEEFLPEKLIAKHNFYGLTLALEQLHFPDSLPQANKSRARFAFEELFVQMLKVNKKSYDWKNKLKSHRLVTDRKQFDRFVSTLPFELTESQTRSINQITTDLCQYHPMNRLLEGDVGTGKTIVAIAASLVTHQNNLRTIYMAPTEILARQHFETFNNYLAKERVKVKLLTGNSKPNGQDWDILIGTHALLFSKEKYKDVGLVIIDEQHRFGVEQREKAVQLGNIEKTPHLLSMTATPIPRTLALTLYGDLSISVLTEHPNKMRKVTTKVVADNQRDKAYEWIANKREPTFIVCPFIQSSENKDFAEIKAAEDEFLKLSQTFFKNIPIGLLHGRMKPKEKEDIIQKFRKGEIMVLVSTPVIEVGIDVPDATIMVIESAERYGLASLHQLRGRVGRGDKEGFCFIFLLFLKFYH